MTDTTRDLHSRLRQALTPYIDPDDDTVPTWPNSGPTPVWVPAGDLIDSALTAIEDTARQEAEADRTRALGLAEGLHAELRAATASRGQTERERDEALAKLDLMTAERDSWRAQLAADWQAQQISDLMAAAGRAHEERDEARRELNDLRESIRDDGTDCTWLADMVRDVITGVSLLGVQSPAEAKRVVSHEVHSLLQANLLAARINSQVIDLAIEPIKAAEAERDEARAALDLMTAERDGYRAQLAADWQAKQIHDLMAAAGRAHEERDEARAALDRVRKVHAPELVQGELWCPEDNERHPCTTWRAADGSKT